jgi:hypothetical protein
VGNDDAKIHRGIQRSLFPTQEKMLAEEEEEEEEEEEDR